MRRTSEPGAYFVASRARPLGDPRASGGAKWLTSSPIGGRLHHCWGRGCGTFFYCCGLDHSHE